MVLTEYGGGILQGAAGKPGHVREGVVWHIVLRIGDGIRLRGIQRGIRCRIYRGIDREIRVDDVRT